MSGPHWFKTIYQAYCLYRWRRSSSSCGRCFPVMDFCPFTLALIQASRVMPKSRLERWETGNLVYENEFCKITVYCAFSNIWVEHRILDANGLLVIYICQFLWIPLKSVDSRKQDRGCEALQVCYTGSSQSPSHKLITMQKYLFLNNWKFSSEIYGIPKVGVLVDFYLDRLKWH